MILETAPSATAAAAAVVYLSRINHRTSQNNCCFLQVNAAADGDASTDVNNSIYFVKTKTKAFHAEPDVT